MTEEEKKEFLLNQADMYLSGMSYRQIAKVVGQSYVTVRNNITVKIKNIAPKKYEEVMKKIEENKEKSIDDALVRERILEAYRLLVAENKTVIEIVDILGTTEFTIYRDLTKRLKELNSIAPEIVSDEMLTKVASTLKKHSSDNITEAKEPIKIELLTSMFPNEEKRRNFLVNCVLTFGLRAETLAMILNESVEVVSKKMLYESTSFYENINLVFQHSMKRQDIALENFEKFYQKLTKAYLSGNKTQIKNVLLEITDQDVKSLLKRKPFDAKKMTSEEILIILKYQIKYMISLEMINKIFELERHFYANKVRNLGDEYSDLISDFNYLCDYYQWQFQISGGTGRK